MPFTPTHTLAILPFAHRFKNLSLSALAIGSMIPDLPLFFPIGIGYWVMHSFLGVPTACVPIGLLVLFIFHRYLKRGLLLLAPLWLRSRLHIMELKEKHWGPAQLGWDAVALAIGAVTHIVWDAFTHQERWGVQWLPALNTITDIFGVHMPGYKVAQHGSSVIGLPLLALFAFLWLRKQVPRMPQGMLPATLRYSVIGVLLLASAITATAAGIATSTRPFEIMAFYIATRFIATFLLLLMVFCVSIELIPKRLARIYGQRLDG